MTTGHPILIGVLLGLAVALCVLCAVGLCVARDPYQRLQFCAPVASVAMPIFALAVWIDDPNWQSRIKATLIAIALLLMNSVISHATARAVRIREIGHWPSTDDEKISRVKQ
jgi:monovalent cation/proton antiporter MnhG/PhaG subunit